MNRSKNYIYIPYLYLFMTGIWKLYNNVIYNNITYRLYNTRNIRTVLFFILTTRQPDFGLWHLTMSFLIINKSYWAPFPFMFQMKSYVHIKLSCFFFISYKINCKKFVIKPVIYGPSLCFKFRLCSMLLQIL